MAGTITITSPLGSQYKVNNDDIALTDVYRLRICSLPDGRQAILKIVLDAKDNGVLDREAFLLKTMRDESDSVEKEYSEKFPGKIPLNYHFCFPQVVETFVLPDYENRRATVLAFHDIIPSGKIPDLVPLSFITERHKLRVDPRTSAWIMGKLLKMLVFTQSVNVTVGDLSADNILINRDQHYVAVFDWTAATIGAVPMTESKAKEEISEVAQAVLEVLGADRSTGKLVADEQLADSQYEDLLRDLSEGKESDPKVAHSRFYKLIRSIWPRKFHPFAGYPI